MTTMGGRREEGAEPGGRGRDDAAGGDGGGGRECSSSTKPPTAVTTTGRVPLHRLFAFADRVDAALMAVGALMAVANGMAQPLMTFIFGDVIDAFGSAGSSNDVLHRVVKVPDPILLASFLTFYFLMMISFFLV